MSSLLFILWFFCHLAPDMGTVMKVDGRESGLSQALVFWWRTKKRNLREVNSTREITEREQLGEMAL